MYTYPALYLTYALALIYHICHNFRHTTPHLSHTPAHF